MKTSALALLVAVVALGLGVVGCEQQTRSTSDDAKQVMGTCPGCGMEAPLGTYCPKCKAVTVAKVKTFTCPTCKKTVKEGTWCEKHNKFRFEHPEMKCPKTGKAVTKGAYCKKCNGYHGLPMVKYDATKKQPYAVTK